MTKLTDTQLVILSAAAQRSDRQVLPLPDRIKGGAAKKVVAGLLKRGLVAERTAGRDDPIWRDTKTGYLRTLVATDAALDALGIEREEPAVALDDPAFAQSAKASANAASWDQLPDHGTASGAVKKARAPREAAEDTDAATPPTSEAPKTRPGTKQATVIAMLRAPDGATIAEIAEATGWQPHTVRGAIAGTLKKKLGLNVVSEKVADRGRTYRIVS